MDPPVDSSLINERHVPFSCFAPGAMSVFLAGSFNTWSRDEDPMFQAGYGVWALTLKLPPGRHEYKFIIDGQWLCDTDCAGHGKCPHCIPNGLGGFNRFIDVE